MHMAFDKMIALRNLLVQFYSWALQMEHFTVVGHFTKRKITPSPARLVLTYENKTSGRVGTSELFNEK